MNKLFVLKNLAYASKVGGGAIAASKEVNDLAPGAIAFLTEDGTVITLSNAATVLKDVKTITIASGRTDENQVLPLVPRFINRINRANYRAFTKPVITVGGTTAAKSLKFVDGEDASIRVTDISYTSRYTPRYATASVYKKASQTIEQAVDSLVTKLNASGFVTATKTGAGVDFGIAITPVEDGVAIETMLNGSLEGGNIENTTAAVYGIGRGVDILQIEKDNSVEEGNGNYIDYTAEHYSRVMETVSTATYDVISMDWEGTHSSPSRSHNVMRNSVQIACDTVGNAAVAPASNQTTTEVMALLALIFPTAYSATVGAETATDSGTANDGVAGN